MSGETRRDATSSAGILLSGPLLVARGTGPGIPGPRRNLAARKIRH